MNWSWFSRQPKLIRPTGKLRHRGKRKLTLQIEMEKIWPIPQRKIGRIGIAQKRKTWWRNAKPEDIATPELTSHIRHHAQLLFEQADQLAYESQRLRNTGIAMQTELCAIRANVSPSVIMLGNLQCNHSPVGLCAYNQTDDPGRYGYICLFCGQPDRRTATAVLGSLADEWAAR
jgi:hypothetical protein